MGDEDWAHFLTLVWSGLVWIARDWSGSAVASLWRDESSQRKRGGRTSQKNVNPLGPLETLNFLTFLPLE